MARKLKKKMTFEERLAQTQAKLDELKTKRRNAHYNRHEWGGSTQMCCRPMF